MSSELMPFWLDTVPDVAHLVRQMRTHAGLTQQYLAERAGLPVSALAKLERADVVDFSIARALRLLCVLGLRVQAVSAPRGPTLADALDEIRNGGSTGPHSR